MDLTAVFESWHVGDGTYPPLRRDQLVRLSFELQLGHPFIPMTETTGELEHCGDAVYRGHGLVLRRYSESSPAIAVIEANNFRFYVHGTAAERAIPGTWVGFEGTLLLDHYAWVEFLGRYADPPDLFYNLRVTRIRRVTIPERFVSRGGGGKSYPTHVGPTEFGKSEDLETMEGQDFEEEFYVLDFNSKGLEPADIPRTFQ